MDKQLHACQVEDVYVMWVGVEATVFMCILPPASTRQVWWYALFFKFSFFCWNRGNKIQFYSYYEDIASQANFLNIKTFSKFWLIKFFTSSQLLFVNHSILLFQQHDENRCAELLLYRCSIACKLFLICKNMSAYLGFTRLNPAHSFFYVLY